MIRMLLSSTSRRCRLPRYNYKQGWADPFNRLISTNKKSASSSWDFDVLVVGGGVVGSTLALNLARQSEQTLKIGLIENRVPTPLEKVKAAALPDLRVYSLSPRSMALLEAVGAWGRLGDRHQPFASMQVWDEGSSGHLRFSAADAGQPVLGSIAENSALQAALYELLVESDSAVTTFCPSKVSNISISASGGPAKVDLENGKGEAVNLTSRLVVGADGGESYVRRRLGVATVGWGYGQRAVVATVRLAGGPGAHKATAWQRYLRTGPLALLPLWDDLASIVWSTTPEHAEHLCGLEEDSFVKELNDALCQGPAFPPVPECPLPGPLGAAITGLGRAAAGLGGALTSLGDAAAPFQMPPEAAGSPGRRFGLDLRLQQARRFAGRRLALVGDAAHTVHPMAGQGLNLGLGDVEKLTEIIIEGLKTGQDIGSPTLLATYDSDRRPRNWAAALGLDALHHVFGSAAGVAAAAGGGVGGPPAVLRGLLPLAEGGLALARGAGLGALNALPGAKAWAAAAAMGVEANNNKAAAGGAGTGAASPTGGGDR